MARLRYRDVDGPQAVDGWLVYIKPLITGSEPADVLNYAAQHPTFPHETTANQWFNESQTESYRLLGQIGIEAGLPSLTRDQSLADWASAQWEQAAEKTQT